MNREQLLIILRLGLIHGVKAAQEFADKTPASWDDIAAKLAAQAVDLLLPLLKGEADAEAPLPTPETQLASELAAAVAAECPDCFPAH